MSESLYFDPLNQPRPVGPVERLPVMGARADMIDMDKVQAHVGRAVELKRYDGVTDPLAYLLHRECMVRVNDVLVPTLAGLLCFGRNPQELIRWAVVDLGHYRSLQALSYELVHLGKAVGGTIMDQLEYLRRYLWTYTQHGMGSGEGFQRVDIHEYPEVVIRELSINMLSHRDYWMPFAQARVMLFRNRIEWSNPGGLPEGITPENILRTQKSRNPTLQTILFEAGYTEGLGQGIDTVVAALSTLEGGDSRSNPTFEDHRDSFIVTVYGRSPDEFYAEEIVGDLNKEQRRLLQFVRQKGEVSTPDIMKRLERSENSVHRDLKVLLNANLIEAVGEARRRRYRLVTTPPTSTHEL